ncbi:MAG: septal ring lytic transglycosylase RlpA family protein [Pedobacter sp.]|nr:MAG: septal ring lytic transglycosylase RlpA family protein [Pedobacter sp.]
MRYFKPMRLLLCLCLLAFTGQAQEVVAKAADTTKKIIYTTYYAKKFEGRKTTSGQRYRSAKFTAAHRTLPFGTIVKVKNLRTGKTVEVRVNDRGPFSKKFSLDISQAAAKTLGIYRLGYARVEISYVLD